MTIETTNNRISYDPDGIVTDFAYDFLVFDQSDMVVYADGIVYTEPYEVTSTGDPDGGLVLFDTPPAASIEELTLLREVPLEQKTEYPPYNPFPAESHEQALDRLTMITQQLQEELDRTAKEPVNTDPDLDLTFPPYDAGKALMYDETTKALTVSDDEVNDITTDAQASADAAAASEAAASVSESNAAASAAAASSSASAAAASEAACAASEAAVIASGDQYLIDIAAAGDDELSQIAAAGDSELADIAAAGDSEIADVIAEGDTQYNRVISAGTVVNKGARQTMLAGPDLEATPSTIETAATKSDDLRNTYHNLGMDMLTGSRGGMSITKDTASTTSYHYLQSSLLSEVQSFLLTGDTDAESIIATMTQQYLANGIQMGGSALLNPVNLYAFQTTHKTVLDGNEWHYNPTSGFAMCKYVGTGVARSLLHPMGKEPLFWAVKDRDSGTNGWRTGRAGSTNYMQLDRNDVENVGATIWTVEADENSISMSTAVAVNTNGNEYFLFGWFGDPLDDLEVGMVGERGVTASFVYQGGSGSLDVDTGITNLQCIMYKAITSTGSWRILNKAASATFNKFTELDTTDAESNQTSVTVSGSTISFAGGSPDYLFVVVGSTADAPDNKLKAATEVLRKVGTAASNHRVDLGAPYAGGDAGGMMFGRGIIVPYDNAIFDTVQGAGVVIYTSNSNAQAVAGNAVTAFTDKGVTLGSGALINSTNINQYTAFNTTHKVTTSDGLEWEYNPLTGFAMCKYVGDGVAGRTLTHPMGKKLRMGWVKALDTVNDWRVYLHTLSATDYMALNTTAASASGTTIWNDTEPDNTTITLGSNVRVNENTQEFILYGWFGDDLSDLETDMTGERGVSAFWQYTGGSGAMSVDTGIENITALLVKNSSTTGNWTLNYNIDGEGSDWYNLNITDAESAGPAYTVEGSVVSYAGSVNDQEFIVFGSKADSGVDSDVVLSSTVDNPTIVSLANGFDEYGQTDIIQKLTASQTLGITGAAGKKYIYMKSDGMLYFTDQRPEYLRDYVPYVKGNHVYDIDKAVMYNASGYDDTLDSPVFLPVATYGQNVTTIGTVTTVEPDSGLVTYGKHSTYYWELGKTYRVRGNLRELSGGTFSLPYSESYTDVPMTTVGLFEYLYTPITQTRMQFRVDAGESAEIEIYSVQEVITDQITPAVFIGECEVANDGSVYDIVTYQKGDVLITPDWGAQYATTVYFDETFGHDEVTLNTQSIKGGIVKDEGFAEISTNERGAYGQVGDGLLSVVTADYRASLTRSLPHDLRLIARRNF